MAKKTIAEVTENEKKTLSLKDIKKLDVIKISEKSLDSKSKNKNESSLVSEEDLILLNKEKEELKMKKREQEDILKDLGVKSKSIKRK